MNDINVIWGISCAEISGKATYSAFLANPTERQRVVGVCGTRDLQQGLRLFSSADSGLALLPLGDWGDVGTSCSC